MIYDLINTGNFFLLLPPNTSKVQTFLGDVWVTTRDVIEVFKVFHDATETFSHAYIPTSSVFCFVAMNIVIAIQDGLQVQCIHDVVSTMREKWLSYYKIINFPRSLLFRAEIQINWASKVFRKLFSYAQHRK